MIYSFFTSKIIFGKKFLTLLFFWFKSVFLAQKKAEDNSLSPPFFKWYLKNQLW
ncbi:hypothetical protein D920_03093 [Enterococcus faecalis 13-SD-W-01]|nr:hypothetical protein D920_03093 [Enterococcus faecalis 13-SD-W-01]